ncbi:MAG: ribbon-helix-helix protein, CopG family [Armatimonadetes bacterium]|nr:ribbon-helix-helix protein, CopG family [Armatimonadota bacterium]
MAHRTTLVLDEESLEAVRDLSHRLHASQSEVIRRAVIAYRQQIAGPSQASRSRRRRILEELFDLFEGHDPEAEVRRLKEEDEFS